jgi:hypothetical protein
LREEKKFLDNWAWGAIEKGLTTVPLYHVARTHHMEQREGKINDSSKELQVPRA